MLLHVPVEIDGPDAAAVGHQRVEAQQIVKQFRRNLVGILCEITQQSVEVFGRMADLMVPMRLPPVGEALPEGEGIARFLRGNQVGGRMATAARIVVILEDGFETVEPADLAVRQGIRYENLVRGHGHVAVAVRLHEFHHRGALEEFEEAELQHVGLQRIDVVERLRKRRHALAGQADDEVNVQVHVVEREDAPDMRSDLLPVVDARDGLQCLLVRRLDADLKLHAAARQARKCREHLFVEVVDGDFEVEIRAHAVRQIDEVLQDGQKMRFLGVEGPVDELDLAHVVAHEEVELAKDARERQEAHAGRRARQAVGARERTAA